MLHYEESKTCIGTPESYYSLMHVLPFEKRLFKQSMVWPMGAQDAERC